MFLIDSASGRILYEKNAFEKLPMASTTKIMTALLLCELGGDLTKEVVTTREMVTIEGSSMGLQVGDTVSYHDLLYGMMLSSGNDAANTTAIALGGSIDGFVKLMNEKVLDIELNRAKTQIKASLLMSLESSSTTAEIMARQMLLFNRIIPTEELVAKIESVSKLRRA